jgi:hypothetical protein
MGVERIDVAAVAERLNRSAGKLEAAQVEPARLIGPGQSRGSEAQLNARTPKWGAAPKVESQPA